MTYRILIVDDSPPMRTVIRKAITASGFGTSEFLEASNGLEALHILRQEWMDIVVTDYNMPQMNGLELVHAMQEDDLTGTVPVLVITTDGSRKRMEQFMEAGARAFLQKPFTPERIKRTLIDILGESRHEESPEAGDEEFDF